MLVLNKHFVLIFTKTNVKKWIGNHVAKPKILNLINNKSIATIINNLNVDKWTELGVLIPNVLKGEQKLWYFNFT